MESFGPVALGLAFGMLSGLFGIGGSSLATPLLRLVFHTPPIVALATPLPVTLLSISGALIGYRSARLIDLKRIAPAGLAGAPASILGALTTKVVTSGLLMALTGAAVIYIGLQVLIFRPQEEGESRSARADPMGMALIGGAVGFLSGMLANGGGVFLVPAFIVLQGMSMKQAVAGSLAVIAAIALPGTITHIALGHVDFALAGKLAVGMLPASYLGSRLALAISNRKLQLLYGVTLLGFGLYFTFTEVTSAISA